MKEEPRAESGLFRGAMRRLSEARESAAQNQINSQKSSNSVKSRDQFNLRLIPLKESMLGPVKITIHHPCL